MVKALEGRIHKGLQGLRLWYSTKYDRKMLLQLQRNRDVGKLVKANDESEYMYIAERDVTIWKSMQVSNVGGNSQGSCGG